MTRNKKVGLILLFLAFSCFLNQAKAQSEKKEIDNIFEALVEDIISENEQDAEQDEIFNDLLFYYNKPVNINAATQDDFEHLHFLNDLQIASLLSYRKKYGTIYSLYELQLIDNFSRNDITRLNSFVETGEIEEHLLQKVRLKYGRHNILLRTQGVVEQAKGFDNASENQYLGSRPKTLIKYRYSLKKNIYAGITAEKDAGEELFKGSQPYGFDFYSAHIFFKGKGTISKLAIGDYTARFGQGLIMWQGYGVRKSTSTLNLRRKGQGIRQYTSTDENNFNRGVGTTVNFKNFEFTPFISFKKIDGRIENSENEDDNENVSSLQTTGIHATQSEIDDKKTVNELITGANINYSFSHLRIGATAVHSRLNKNVEASSLTYSKFRNVYFNSFAASADYLLTLKGIHIFGEFAANKDKKFAMINGLAMSILPQVSVSLLHRNFSTEYFSQFASAFAEQGQISNEKGFYTGIEIHPIPYFTLEAYSDIYHFPWISYQNSAPVRGKDFLVKASFFKNRFFSGYVKIKHESKPQNLTGEVVGIKENTEEIKSSFRFYTSTRLNDKILLKNRIELSRYEHDTKEQGFLFSQDIKYNSSSLPLSVSFRYAYFATDGYNSRIYAYENDVYLSFSVPAYYEKGFRSYLVCKYSFSDDIDFWFRISQTKYRDKDEIGSGLSLIEKNRKTELKLQLIIKL